MNCSTPGFPVFHYFLEFAQTHVHWASYDIQPSHPLSPPSLSSVFPSIRVFSNESVLRIRWPKYWSFNFSISPSTEYSGLISFRIYWLDLLAIQGTLKSLLQHHNLKASNSLVLSLLYIRSNSHIHTWLLEKPSLWLIWAFVGKVMSLLFNMLSRFVITFLPRRKCLLISWQQSLSTVILVDRTPQNKICPCFHFFPIYLPWSDRTGCHYLHFLNVEFQANFFTLLFHPHQEVL